MPLCALRAPPACFAGRMAVYPPALLADLAVQLLAEASAGAFSPAQALGGMQSSTRGVAPARGCCLATNFEELNKMAGNPFYFARDADGYTLVNIRVPVDGWPMDRRGRRPLPVRLARWLLSAGPGEVVRHRCDARACIRIDHLMIGTQQENLADALRRGRRRHRALGGIRKQPHRAARAERA